MTGSWDTVRISDRCTACGLCLNTCPERALLVAPRRPAVVDRRCTACGECIEICPVGATAVRMAPTPAAAPQATGTVHP